jgi:dipeptidase E
VTGTPERIVVAMGGGGFSMDPDTLLDDHILDIARERRGQTRPRVCFLGTASGDADGYLARFYSAFARRAEASHLALFVRTETHIERFLLDQDVVYVGGGNTANMLAIWRVHGIDQLMREAWEQGTILWGASAGMICWFEQGITDSFGPQLEAMDCLGFLPGSACPHYDGEERRRPRYRELVDGGLGEGLAADDGVALHYVGTELQEIVSCRPGATAYRVTRDGEERLAARMLG